MKRASYLGKMERLKMFKPLFKSRKVISAAWKAIGTLGDLNDLKYDQESFGILKKLAENRVGEIGFDFDLVLFNFEPFISDLAP